jgi:hypothetical protein
VRLNEDGQMYETKIEINQLITEYVIKSINKQRLTGIYTYTHKTDRQTEIDR